MIVSAICHSCGKFYHKPGPCECRAEVSMSKRSPLFKGINTDCVNNERVSMALGVDQSQIDSGEAESVHPGAKYDKNGSMIIGSRAEKKKRLKERNWVEYD